MFVKVKVINSSSKKTREAIKKAFAEEIEIKKELKKVTITELVKKAGITRGTFYTHYDNIYDVAKDFQDETLDVLFSNMRDLHSIDDINHYFDEVMNYFKEHEEVYYMLLKCEDTLIFMERLTKLITKNINEYLKNKNIKDLSLNVIFFTNGCINLVVKYFKKEIDESLDDISGYMKKTFFKLFS